MTEPPQNPPARNSAEIERGDIDIDFDLKKLDGMAYNQVKRIFDIVLASIALILAAPALLAISLLVRLDGGTALYSHKRVGQRGQLFNCLKFRSMRTDSDELLRQVLKSDDTARAEWEADHKLTDDPRVTPLGRFMRATSIDELPQLINIVRGDMSLVGPRPIVEAELVKYGQHRDLYLRAIPGLTGLWQVSGRSDTTYEQRVALDVEYIKRWSLSLDLVILLRTIRVVLKGKGAY
jgi:undecaprenyl-phosphate galactose phosphotransferase